MTDQLPIAANYHPRELRLPAGRVNDGFHIDRVCDDSKNSCYCRALRLERLLAFGSGPADPQLPDFESSSLAEWGWVLGEGTISMEFPQRLTSRKILEDLIQRSRNRVTSIFPSEDDVLDCSRAYAVIHNRETIWDPQAGHLEGDNLPILAEQKIEPTYACFEFRFFPTHGLMISSNNASPTAMTSGDLYPPSLPDLKHWSDVAFLSWKEATLTAEKPCGTLRTVLFTDISNRATLELLFLALEDRGFRCGPPRYPGYQIVGPSDHPGVLKKAIMGTPVVSSLVWMLLQYPEHFRRLEILSVSVFDNSITERQIFDGYRKWSRPCLALQLGCRSGYVSVLEPGT